MSQTYELHCDQCGVYLWIGQATKQNPAGWYHYHGDGRDGGQDYNLALHLFMRAHEGHSLRFQASGEQGIENEQVILKGGELVVDLLDPPGPDAPRH